MSDYEYEDCTLVEALDRFHEELEAYHEMKETEVAPLRAARDAGGNVSRAELSHYLGVINGVYYYDKIFMKLFTENFGLVTKRYCEQEWAKQEGEDQITVTDAEFDEFVENHTDAFISEGNYPGRVQDLRPLIGVFRKILLNDLDDEDQLALSIADAMDAGIEDIHVSALKNGFEEFCNWADEMVTQIEKEMGVDPNPRNTRQYNADHIRSSFLPALKP